MDIRLKGKKIFFNSLVACLICAFILAASAVVLNASRGISDTAAQGEAFASQLSALKLQTAQIETELEENKIKLSSETNDEYLMYLGTLAKNCEVTIRKLQTLPSTQNFCVTTTQNRIEVQGAIKNIAQFQNGVSGGKAAKIVNVSVRQNNELLWLARDFDNIKILPWLEFEQDNEAIDTVADEPAQQLDLSQLFNQSDMLGYFEIEYYN